MSKPMSATRSSHPNASPRDVGRREGSGGNTVREHGGTERPQSQYAQRERLGQAT